MLSWWTNIPDCYYWRTLPLPCYCMADGTTYQSYIMGEWNPITRVPIDAPRMEVSSTALLLHGRWHYISIIYNGGVESNNKGSYRCPQDGGVVHGPRHSFHFSSHIILVHLMGGIGTIDRYHETPMDLYGLHIYTCTTTSYHPMNMFCNVMRGTPGS
jgi:hypothetical protein